MSEQERFVDVLEKLEARVLEYTGEVERHQEQLIGIIVYLMHKHHYTDLSIPLGHHRDCVETRTVRLGLGEETLNVTMEAKPQTFDEFVENPPKPDDVSTGELRKEVSGAVVQEGNNWFQLAQAICNPGEQILPAIDRNAI